MEPDRVICDSGLEGWQARLRENYTSFREFAGYCEAYGLLERLGYASAKEAWKANPVIQGSTIPSDFRRSEK